MKHWCLGDISENSQKRKSCREFNAILFLKVANFLAQFNLHANPMDTSNLTLWNEPWSLNIFLEPIFQVFYIHIFHKASLAHPVFASRKIRDLYKDALTLSSKAQSWTKFSLTVWLQHPPMLSISSNRNNALTPPSEELWILTPMF